MKCSNCYIQKKCISHISYFMGVDEVTGKEYDDMEKKCQDFIDKDKIKKIPCKVGDTAYVVEVHNDGVKRMTTMKVGRIVPFGSVSSGEVWNMYLVTDKTYSYKSFYDIGHTVFFDWDSAIKALRS